MGFQRYLSVFDAPQINVYPLTASAVAMTGIKYKPDNGINGLVGLNWHALQFAHYLAVRTERHILLGESKDSIKAYPACAACAKIPICAQIGYGYSGQVTKETSFVQEVKDALNGLGKIGERTPDTKNPIGHCAEQGAVNYLLRNCSKCLGHNSKCVEEEGRQPGLQDCIVSAAYRPRTLEYIARCPNCVKLIGDEH